MQPSVSTEGFYITKVKTNIPIAILYQPHQASGFVVSILINHFIVNREVRNATTDPKIIRDHFELVIDGTEWSSTTLAPIIVGIPSKKEKETI